MYAPRGLETWWKTFLLIENSGIKQYDTHSQLYDKKHLRILQILFTLEIEKDHRLYGSTGPCE